MLWPHNLQPTNEHLQDVVLFLIKTAKIMCLLDCIVNIKSILFIAEGKYKTQKMSICCGGFRKPSTKPFNFFLLIINSLFASLI